MITRFRLEAQEKTREDCVMRLTESADALIQISGVNRSLWKCTGEVIERNGLSYRGRVVWKVELYPPPIPNRSRDTISEGDWNESRGE